MSAPEYSRSKESGKKFIADALKEHRRFRRVRLAITGRLYILATQEEAICTVEDISPGGASVRCELEQEPKGRAVIYFDMLGRFEGPIARAENGSFAISFFCSGQRRDRLADRLTLEINRHLLSGTDLSRFGRTKVATGSSTQFTRSTGEQVTCEIIDRSLSGISVRTKLKPALGEHILIGNRAGRIARHHHEGIGIEFLGSVPSAAPADIHRDPASGGPISAPTLEQDSAPAVVAMAERT